MLKDEQKRLVEDHHNLIYYMIHKCKLPEEEYYDILAIALCKAAINYDETKGEFSTIACNYMLNAIRTNCQFEKCVKRSAIVYSLNNMDSLGYDKDYSFCNQQILFYDPIDLKVEVEKEAVSNVYIENILESIPDKKKRILQMRMEGFTFEEISNEYGVTHQAIQWTIKSIREYITRNKKSLAIE